MINLSTNYEQAPDGSYRQGRVYTRADNPTSEHAEQLLAAGAVGGGADDPVGVRVGAASGSVVVGSVGPPSAPRAHGERFRTSSPRIFAAISTPQPGSVNIRGASAVTSARRKLPLVASSSP